MRKSFVLILLISIACASKPRSTTAADVPAGSLELKVALRQSPEATLAYLKGQATVAGYTVSPRDPAAQIPDSLKASRTKSAVVEKRLLQQHLRRFRPMSFERKAKRAEELNAEFSCDHVSEAQALGFSLELDFPKDEARSNAQNLHEKVLTCENYPQHESYFRLALMAIQANDCPKALGYLNKFPASQERGVSDRLSYIKSFCSESKEVAQRNPWGGYGVLLKDAKRDDKNEPSWILATKSGQEDWDRLLVTFMELYEKNQSHSIQYLAAKMDYEKFRSLPRSFQASMLVMMNYAGADLSVFQILHRYLSDHPEDISTSVVGLLFPTRYWEEIVTSSQVADPVLVKSLIRQESAFNPSAHSRAKAMGLMQLIYPTARSFGITRKQQLLSPEDNIRAGSQFLGHLIEEFGSVELALAAYNAGPGMVRQWQKRYPTENRELFVEMIPYTETREYVRLVKRNYAVYQTFLTKPELLRTASVAAEVRAPANDDENSAAVFQTLVSEPFQRMIP